MYTRRKEVILILIFNFLNFFLTELHKRLFPHLFSRDALIKI